MSETTIVGGDVAAQLAAAQAENERLQQQLADQEANAQVAAVLAENQRLQQQLADQAAAVPAPPAQLPPGFQVPVPAAAVPSAPAAPAPPTPQMSADHAAEIAVLRAQVEQLMAQLTAMGSAAVAAPEPRFHSIFDLFRELARRSLASDVLHEFLAVVDQLDEEAHPVEQPATGTAAAAPPGA